MSVGYWALSPILVQVAACAVVKFSDGPKSNIVHLSHPMSTPWTILAKTLSSELCVPLVTYSEWLSKLARVKTAKTGVATMRLLGFNENMHEKINAKHSFAEAFGLPHLDTAHAVALYTTSLGKAEPVTEEDALRWLAYWRAVGYIPPN